MVTDGYPIERDTSTMDTSDSYCLEHLTSPYRVGKPPLRLSMVTDGYPIERDTLTMDTSDSYRLEHLTSPYRVGKPPLKRFPLNNIQQSDTLRAPTPLPPSTPEREILIFALLSH